MDILQFNLPWMLFNAWLALLPALFIELSLIFRQKLLKIIFLLLWLLYIPNTIYIICDLTHLMAQWPLLHGQEKFALLLQYVALEGCGLLTFLFGLAPFHKMLNHSHWKKSATKILVVLNFLIGFAIVLGKIERVNSWEVVTNPTHLIASSFHALTYLPLLGLVILFGCFTNLVYFTAKELRII